MRMISELSELLSVAFFVSTFVYAQNTPVPIEDISGGHVIACLNFHNALTAEISRRNQTTSASGQGLLEAALTGMGIGRADFQKITQKAHLVRAAHEAIKAEAVAYRENCRAVGNSPDIAVLKELSFRRDELGRRALKELRMELSPAGWKAFFAYFTREFLKKSVSAKLK